jgi:hypothetical protein
VVAASGNSRALAAAASVSAGGFGALSRLRRKRIFHPHGVGFAALLRPLPAGAETGAAVLEEESEVVVRLSRALGLPEWLPDPCGLAVRVPDAYGSGRHQDVLMVSSGCGRVGRHALLPARDFLARPYSTLLPYSLGEETVLIGARGITGAGPGPKLGELRRRDRAGLDFELLLAGVGGGWRPVATLSLRQRLPAERTERLGFDPTNTGGGLELAGPINRFRGPSYRGSQAGRDAAYAGGARASGRSPGAARSGPR